MAKARREFSNSMKDLQETFSNKLEQHIEDIDKKRERTAPSMALSLIPHLLGLFFCVVIIWVSKPGSSIFSWHPTLMSLAFMFFMAEGVLTFSNWFSLIPYSSRDLKNTWHWALHAAALTTAYTGLAAISYVKYTNQKAHYTTWHGLLGINVCCILAVQASGGIVETYPSLLPFTVRKVVLKRLHAFFGTVMFTVAMATTVLGLYSTWFSANVDNQYLWGACCVCPVVMFSAVFVQFVKNHVTLMFKKY